MLFRILFITLLGLSHLSHSQMDGYAHIDKHARRVAKSRTKNYKTIAHKLVEPASTELEKARAIYTWVATYFDYDVVRWKSRKAKLQSYSINELIKRKRGICGDLAKVYKAMCDEVGIKCYYVSGWAPRRISKVFPNLERHAWNVIKIDSNWYTIDATWGCGTVMKRRDAKRLIGKGRAWQSFKKRSNHHGKWYFVKRTSSNYFCSDVEFFNQTHCARTAFFQLEDNITKRSAFAHGNRRVKKKYLPYSFKDSLNKYDNKEYWHKEIYELENQMPVQTRTRFELADVYGHVADSCSENLSNIDSIPQLNKCKYLYKKSIKHRIGNGIYFTLKYPAYVTAALLIKKPVKKVIEKTDIKFTVLNVVGVVFGSLFAIGAAMYTTAMIVRKDARIIRHLFRINQINSRIKSLKSVDNKEVR